MNNIDLKENQGIAFTNKKSNTKQPDFKGELQIDGKRLNVAIWDRTSQNGNRFLSIMVEEPRQKPAEKPEPKPTPSDPFDLDDEIKF